jgi:hypothetical protein
MNGYKRLLIVVIISIPLVMLSAWDSNAQFGITQQQAPQASDQICLSSASGRFVFGQVSSSSKDKFMLDTDTGRLWQIAESGEVGLFLREVPYRVDKEYSPLPKSLSESDPGRTEKNK